MGKVPIALQVFINDTYVCKFSYGLRGFVPDFTMSNGETSHLFLERGSNSQIKQFKQAYSNGFTNIAH